MSKGKTVKIVIICILLAVIAVSAGYIAWYFTLGKIDSSPYKNNESTTSGELSANPIDFEALYAVNPDVYAWIQIPNTRIDYPILQSGVDNTDDNFYINHDMNKQSAKAGSIYSQRLNSKDFSDPNTVLYGHNMKNGSMFRDLRKFRDEEFFNQNKYIYVYTKGHILTYEIFSAYRYDDRHILNSFDFSDKAVYAEYLEFATNPVSIIKNVRQGRTITTEDRIITLSTCMNYGKYRYLVQGVLIKDEPTK